MQALAQHAAAVDGEPARRPRRGAARTPTSAAIDRRDGRDRRDPPPRCRGDRARADGPPQARDQRQLGQVAGDRDRGATADAGRAQRRPHRRLRRPEALALGHALGRERRAQQRVRHGGPARRVEAGARDGRFDARRAPRPSAGARRYAASAAASHVATSPSRATTRRAAPRAVQADDRRASPPAPRARPARPPARCASARALSAGATSA